MENKEKKNLKLQDKKVKVILVAALLLLFIILSTTIAKRYGLGGYINNLIISQQTEASDETGTQIDGNGTVIVKYQDYYTKTDIADAVTKTDIVGNSFDISSEVKTIEGYTLIEEPTEKSGVYTEEEQQFTYYYAKNSDVRVTYLDRISNEPVSDEVIISGYQGLEYEAEQKEIEGYTCVGRTTNNTGTMRDERIEVKYYYLYNTKVIVEYTDKETDFVFAKGTIEGLEGYTYETIARDFENYMLVEEPENAVGTMTRETITLKYYYTQIESGVIEKHIDDITEELLAEEHYEGSEGDTYTTNSKEIAGYKLLEEKLPTNSSGVMTADVIEVKYYYIKEARVRVEYIDKITNKKLTEDVIINGYENDSYSTEAKTFEEYTLVETPENASGTMEVSKNEDGTLNNEIVVTYYYAHVSEGVLEKHIDESTGNILYEQTHTGNQGDAYTTREKIFTGYTLATDKYPENATGTMAIDLIEVTYYYNPIQVEETEGTNVKIEKTATTAIEDRSAVVTYTIKCTARIESYTGKAAVTIVDTLPYAIDAESSAFGEGVYDETNKTITWEVDLGDIDASVEAGVLAEIRTIEKTFQVIYKDIDVLQDSMTNKVKGALYLPAQDILAEAEDEAETIIGVAGNVLVKYIDKYTAEEISETITKTGKVGNSFDISEDVKEIEGYTLIEEPEIKTGLYKEEVQEKHYYYVKNAEVYVKYVDKETLETITEETISGYEGKEYATEQKEFEGYEIVMEQYPSNATGTMTREKVEVVYYYKAKQFSITTSVKTSTVTDGEGNTTEVAGGSISGQGETPYETVKYGNNSTKEIKIVPDEEYQVKEITVNAVPIEFSVQEDRTVILDIFENVKEDKEVVVEFEKRTGTVIVHHYIEGTEAKLSEDVIKTDYIGEIYEINEAEDIPANYEVVKTEGETTGVYIDGTIVVIYYYKLKEASIENSAVEVTATEAINERTEKITYNIKYTAQIDSYMGNAQITLEKSLPYAIDEEESNLDGGIYDEENKTIIWNISVENIDTFTNGLKDILVEKNIELLYTDIDVLQDTMVSNINAEIYLPTNNHTVQNETEAETLIDVKGNVVVKYVDKYTNEEISETITKTEKVGKDFDVSGDVKEIEGYTLIEEPEMKTGLYKEEEQELIYYYAKNSNVNVAYIDKATNEELTEKTTIAGHQGKTYETEQKVIEGYTFIESEGKTSGEMTGEDIDVIYYYAYNTKVIVQHIDKDTDVVLETVTQEGYEGDTYTSSRRNIENYILAEEPEETTVTMTREVIILKYYYTKVESGLIERHTDDITGEVLYEQILTGNVGDSYNIVEREFEGYELVSEKYPENASGTMTEGTIEVNYYYRKLAKVIVEYIDKTTNEKLVENVVINGYEGQEYTTEAKVFEGYTLEKIPENTEGTMVVTRNENGTFNNEILVQYYYIPKAAGVREKHISEVTGKILYEQLHEGNEGEEYSFTEKEFEGYELNTERYPENATGTMTKEEIVVEFYYGIKEANVENSITKEATESIDERTDKVSYKITYTAKVDTYIGKAGLTLVDYLPYAIDEEASSLDGGVYDVEAKTITWEVDLGEIDTLATGENIAEEINIEKNIELLYKDIDLLQDKMTNEVRSGLFLASQNKLVEDEAEDDTVIDVKGKVIVKYVDKYIDEEISDRVEKEDKVGNSFDISEDVKEIEGYTLVEEPEMKTGLYKEEDQELIYYYAKNTDVHVTYVDKATGEEIAEEQTITGYEGLAYETESKEIEGYSLVKNTNNTIGTMTREKIEVIYYYSYNTKITVQYIDKDTEEILDTMTKNGVEGETYRTFQKDIQYYMLAEAPAEEIVIMTKEAVIVKYYYTKITEGVIEKHVDEITGEVLYEALYQLPKEEENVDQEENARVLLLYKDANVYNNGVTENTYTTEAKEFSGYGLVEEKLPSNAAGIITEEVSEVKYYYKKEAKVIVQYLDNLTKENIIDDIVITGYENDAYVTEEKTFDGYRLVELPSNNVGTMIVTENSDGTFNNEIIVQYYYTKVSGVKEIHISNTTGEILYEEFHEKNEGDTYSISEKEFEGYEIVSDSYPENAEGTITNEMQEVKFYYEIKDVNISKDELSKEAVEGTNVIDEKTDRVSYKIVYSAELDTYIGDASVTLIDTLPYMIDEEESNLDGGVYNEEAKTITWNIDLGKLDTLATGKNVVETIDIEKNINIAYKDINILEESMINKVDATLSLPAQEKNEAAYAEAETIIDVKGNVIVKYIDKNTNEELSEAVIKTEKVGNAFDINTDVKEIEGYTLIEEPAVKTGTYTEDTQEFVYYYAKTSDVKVTYIDLATNTEIAESVIITGYEGKEYEAKEKAIEGYTLVRNTNNIEGTMTKERIEVVYYYSYNTKVIVQYIDKDTDDILDTVTKDGVEGEIYKAIAKDIEFYMLAETPENEIVKMTKEEIIVKYYYTEITEGVIEKHVDEITGEVIEEKHHSKNDGDSYTTEEKTFDGYVIVEERKPENPSGTIPEEVSEVKYYYRKEAKVIVQYLDNLTKENIVDNVVIEGYESKEYQTEEKTFEEYTLVNIVGNTDGQMTVTVNEDGTYNNEIVVTYYYVHKSEGVKVIHMSETTEEILYEDTLTGNEGDPYKALEMEFEGYELNTEKYPDNAEGFMEIDEKVVTFYYNIKDVSISDSTLVKKGPARITNTNDKVKYEITYTAKIDTYIGEGTITLVDELPYEIDEEASSLAEGIYDVANKTITWEIDLGEIDTLESGNNITKEVNENKTIELVYQDIDLTKESMKNEAEVNLYLPAQDKIETAIAEAETIIDVKGNVIVKYIDKYTNEEIFDEVVKTEKVGSEFNIVEDKKEINGYTLIEEPELTEGTYTEENQEFTYYYAKNTDVHVTYIDKATGNEIADEVIIEGYEGKEYTTEEKIIEGYTFVESTNNVAGTMESDRTEVIYYYSYNTKVIVQYVDKETDTVLDTVVQEGLEGDIYETIAKEIEGYILVQEPEEKTVTMTKNEIIVKYYYEVVEGGVLEKHIDQITGEIIKQELHEGKEGDAYSTSKKEFTGYDFIEVIGTPAGTISSEVIEVKYYYKKIAKVIVQHIDKMTNDKIVEDVIIEGYEKDTYNTEEKEIDGYHLVEKPSNSNGEMIVIKNEDGTFNNETIVKYYYLYKAGGVIEKHIDIKSNKVLAETKHEGYEGQEYSTAEKEFIGYKLVEDRYPENAKGKMTKESIEVTYYYIKEVEIVVEYVDKYTGKKILPDEVIEGLEGDAYKVAEKEIDGYEIIEVIGKPEGIMDPDGDVKITYYYAKPATVITKYIDEEKNSDIAEQIVQKGHQGDKYITSAKEIEYYKISKLPNNSTGTMNGTTEVIYYYRKAKFDLSINKTISSLKINGKSKSITDANLVKAEIYRKDINSTTIKIQYNIAVTNTGEIPGKAVILEKIPANLKMNKQENTGWTINGNEARYETEEIAPGETKNYKVVMQWIKGSKNFGSLTSIAKIEKTENIAGYDEIDVTNNTSSAEVIVTVSTGVEKVSGIVIVGIIYLLAAVYVNKRLDYIKIKVQNDK